MSQPNEGHTCAECACYSPSGWGEMGGDCARRFRPVGRKLPACADFRLKTKPEKKGETK